MSEDTKKEVEKQAADDGQQKNGDGNPIIGALDQMRSSIDEFKTETKESVDSIRKELEEAKKPIHPDGLPNGVNALTGGFSVREGENVMSSRPYSLLMVAKRLAMQKANVKGWENIAKTEADLSERLQTSYYGQAAGVWKDFSQSSFLIPFGSELMPIEERTTDEGITMPGVPQSLRKECRDMMSWGTADLDELRFLGLPIKKSSVAFAKDLSHQTATSGGTMVAEAAQGELINVLRAQELFSQVGAQQIDLPPQGQITFPRVNTSVTVAATTEGATISESTPTTGQLRLQAKPYSALTDIAEELLKFASVSVEAWLRNEMARESALKTDRDMINGAGGTAIQGVINYSGINLRTASTTGANGDTLDAEDPFLLYGDIADQDAPVDATFFYAMTNSLWARYATRQSDNIFIFSNLSQTVAGGRPNKSINGEMVICSTQMPTNRDKGSSTDLQILLAGVGREWIIARSGVISVTMTDSDASKFQQRLSTMRATTYVDAGPVHEESFGWIDDVDEDN